MGRAYDPIAATRAMISQFGLTDSGAVLFEGRPGSPEQVEILKRAIATLEDLLQQMVDDEALAVPVDILSASR